MSVIRAKDDQQKDRDLVALAGAWFTLNFVILTIPESLPPLVRQKPYRPPYQVLRHYNNLGSDDHVDHQLTCRLMRPADESSPAPLLVFLHGSGQSGVDNRRHLKGLPSRMASSWNRRDFPCYLLVPQCPPQSSWRREANRLVKLIEHVRDSHRVDPERVYVTGISMGGFGAWRLAAERPDLFAAAVPVCGGGDRRRAKQLASVPIWAIHGNEDTVIPVEKSREMVQAVREAGGNPRYTELQGVGHNCWSIAYREESGVLAWMFEQQRIEPTGNQRADVSPSATAPLTSRQAHE